MELDDVWRHLGDFGRYQTLAYVLISIVGTWIPSWQIFGIIFTADRPPFHCRPWPNLTLEESLPPAAWDSEGGGGGGNATACLMYGLADEPSESAGADVTADGGWASGVPVVNTSDLVPCSNGIEYEPLYGENTIVMELDLVCDQEILASTAQSILFVGVLTGAFVFGQLSDLIGRKTVLLLSLLLESVAGIAICFVHRYHWFVMLWFFVGMCEQGINLSEYVLIMEMFSPKRRSMAGCINNISWGVGVTLLAPIAYFLRDWRTMQLAISIPCLLAIPLWFVLYESPRWLLYKGRDREALRILNRIGRVNRIKPPAGGYVLTHDGRTVREYESAPHDGREPAGAVEVRPGGAARPTAAATKTHTFVDLLRSRRVFANLLIMCFSWFVNSMVYYGVALYSSRLTGNKYFNFFILAVVEIPAYIVITFTLIRWGRRPSLFLFHLLAGIACIITACLPRDTEEGSPIAVAVLVSAVVGKLCITASFGVAFLYGTEIFPTPVRNIGFGISSFFGRVGSILAPFIVYLDSVSPYIPLNIFGGLSLLAAGLVLLLPETLNRPLPETMRDAEELGRTPPLPTKEGRPGKEKEQRPGGELQAPQWISHGDAGEHQKQQEDRV